MGQARGTGGAGLMTGRVAGLPRAQLATAVAASSSWREVARRLELRAGRDVTAVRQRCAEEGVPTAHLPGSEADAAFAAQVAAAPGWPELLTGLGYAAGSGSARATVRGRARRLGLGLDHLEEREDAPEDLVARLGPLRPELLRTAAPALFAAELLQRGCSVSWPLEPVPHDLVAHLPGAGALRVQVKSSTMRRGPSWELRLVRGDRGGGGAYASEEVDAFGLVDGDRRAYLVPVAAIEGRASISTAALGRYRLLA